LWLLCLILSHQPVNRQFLSIHSCPGGGPAVPQGAAAAGAGTERQGPARAAPVAATPAPGETGPLVGPLVAPQGCHEGMV